MQPQPDLPGFKRMNGPENGSEKTKSRFKRTGRIPDGTAGFAFSGGFHGRKAGSGRMKWKLTVFVRLYRRNLVQKPDFSDNLHLF